MQMKKISPLENALKLLPEDTLMSYANEDDLTPEDHLKLLSEDTHNLSIETTRVTTIDKRKQKNREVKVLSPEKKIMMLEVDEKVKEFCSKYLRNIFFKAKDPCGCYQLHHEVFNSKNSKALPDQRKCTNYCFTSYFTSKLLANLEKFSFGSCKKELARITKEVNLMKCDMKVNFSHLCKAAELIIKDVASFTEIIPTGYPHQLTLHDCVFFVILYMLYWDDIVLRDFNIIDFDELRAN